MSESNKPPAGPDTERAPEPDLAEAIEDFASDLDECIEALSASVTNLRGLAGAMRLVAKH